MRGSRPPNPRLGRPRQEPRSKAEATLVDRLKEQLDQRGPLDVLRNGIDDATQLRVRFADGIDPSWAEYVLGQHAVDILATIGTDPPQYLVEPTDGSTSPQMSVELLDEADVSWARPAEP